MATATRRASSALHWATVAALAALLAWMVFDIPGFERLLRVFVPDKPEVIYPTVPLPQLMLDQIYLVALASALALAIGLALGLLALSRFGRPFRDVIVNLGNLAQTVPTVAVMALAIPLTGYGARPVIIALTLYSILPIMLNVIVGIEGVQPAALDAAIGVGMSPLQRLVSVQLPLAFPVILGGIKNMLVINVSAATIGAIAGAGGLGQPILAGFNRYNTAYIIEGALPAAVLALLVDRLLTLSAHRDAERAA
ncbi:MAG: ABC transporter permease subunit [Coriobacteriia bacterium]|nr:ABC transporter permease subunit [Coriobacteriia bacterium]